MKTIIMTEESNESLDFFFFSGPLKSSAPPTFDVFADFLSFLATSVCFSSFLTLN